MPCGCTSHEGYTHFAHAHFTYKGAFGLTSALLRPGSHVGFSLFLHHLLRWSPQEELKHLFVFLALVQIWCNPGGGTWCVILSTVQKKRCKIRLQARHRAKRDVWALTASWCFEPPTLFWDLLPLEPDLLFRGRHIKPIWDLPLVLLLLWRCWFPSLTLWSLSQNWCLFCC